MTRSSTRATGTSSMASASAVLGAAPGIGQVDIGPEAGGVREQVADGDVALPVALEAGDVAGHRIDQAQPAFFDQLHHAGRRRDDLGQRGRVEDRVQRHRLARRQRGPRPDRLPDEDAIARARRRPPRPAAASRRSRRRPAHGRASPAPSRRRPGREPRPCPWRVPAAAPARATASQRARISADYTGSGTRAPLQSIRRVRNMTSASITNTKTEPTSRATSSSCRSTNSTP